MFTFSLCDNMGRKMGLDKHLSIVNTFSIYCTYTISCYKIFEDVYRGSLLTFATFIEAVSIVVKTEDTFTWCSLSIMSNKRKRWSSGLCCKSLQLLSVKFTYTKWSIEPKEFWLSFFSLGCCMKYVGNTLYGEQQKYVVLSTSDIHCIDYVRNTWYRACQRSRKEQMLCTACSRVKPVAIVWQQSVTIRRTPFAGSRLFTCESRCRDEETGVCLLISFRQDTDSHKSGLDNTDAHRCVGGWR